MIYAPSSERFITTLSEDLPQGILLSGPEGIGLKTLAYDLAGRHTKEIMLVCPDEKGSIRIDTVRELYTLARAKGVLSVFIIDDADAMGHEAQNALLKLLEEPNASVRFILTSHWPQGLLPTIRSRVAEYPVVPVSEAQSRELLKEWGISEPTKLAQLLFIAQGLPAALRRYADDDAAFSARSAVVRDARTFLQGSREERLLLAAAYKDRQAALGLLRDCQKLLRRSVEAKPSAAGAESLEQSLAAEAALLENASVRLTLTTLALAL